MEFTELLDEYLELKQLYDNQQLSEHRRARFYEIRNKLNLLINKRINDGMDKRRG